MFGEGIVATVVCRHRHDGTGTVTGQHVIGDINRYLALRKRVDGVRTGEHTCYAAVRYTFTLRTMLHPSEVFFYLGFVFIGHYTLYVLALRR